MEGTINQNLLQGLLVRFHLPLHQTHLRALTLLLKDISLETSYNKAEQIYKHDGKEKNKK